jgi:hypothetical protein
MATAARELVPARGKKVDGRRNNRGMVGHRGGSGRPEWRPEKQRVKVPDRLNTWRMETDEEAWERTRQLVQHYSAIGYPHEVIARLVQPICDPDTLAKHFRFELDNGKLVADGRMAGTAYQLGVTGRDPAMCRFWIRARMGWRDTGDAPPKGEPIQYELVDGDEQW